MKKRPYWLLCTVLPIALLADSQEFDSRKIAPPSSSGQIVFTLLPKSFVRNPKLDMTVFGLVTPAGYAMPLPDPRHPVRYIAQAGNTRPDPYTLAGQSSPNAPVIAKSVEKALATAGYTPAEEGKPADLAIAYTWGFVNQLAPLSTRAVLVGGGKFATEFLGVMHQNREQQRMLHDTQLGTTRGGGAGAFAGIDLEAISPLHRYLRKEWDNDALYQQVTGAFYFIVISAYDYAALARGERTLLWRTRLTVDATGVSLRETIPSLLTYASPYLGKDTQGPGSFMKPVYRRSQVEIGTPEVKEYLAPRISIPTEK